ncbi:MAG: sigma-70 family RNA polymerase sigma factor [Chloroflexi bacterium]|nr:sigma-70 family RNA polymerase sigma factor [Chloroflexota bacterium]
MRAAYAYFTDDPYPFKLPTNRLTPRAILRVEAPAAVSRPYAATLRAAATYSDVTAYGLCHACGEINVSDPTVNEWVNAALAGDHDAFAELVYAFQDSVYNLCYRILGERMEAEDAAQEAFLRAYSNLHRYDPLRPFKTWLLAIASNHAIDRIRKRRLTWISIDSEEPGPQLSLSSDEPEPEEETLHRERSREIQKLLNELPPDYRAAVVLRYWYDYSYVEIADMLDTTESAIKSRLFRARQLLAEKLSPQQAARMLSPLMEGI